jgi:hypothetical protein
MIRIATVSMACGALLIAACGGAGAPGARSGNDYQEYECPAPIGKIVREDCSRSALQYQGASFQGSVGAAGIGASASYREGAIREADSLVAMLKEQRVGLCNNFNTCKLTVAEYRDEQKELDDSYVALLALRDKMAQLDAEGAAKLLEEIQKIRMSVRHGGGDQSTGAPAAPTTPVASGEFDPNFYYRLLNVAFGEARSLDTYADGVNAPHCGKSGDYAGEYWKLTPLADGTFRLTNSFLGDGRSLDTFSDGENAPNMNKTGDFSGQHWRLIPVGDGTYRLMNVFLGSARALEARKDDAGSLVMGNAVTDRAEQHWKIVKVRRVTSP